MRVLILGGDGYLGWPTAMRLATHGHDVMVADNYLRRRLASELGVAPLFPVPSLTERASRFAAVTSREIRVAEGDCRERVFVDGLMREFEPDAVVHYAEQPSAPYSMIGRDQARHTLENNLGTTFTLIWSVLENAPGCHIIKLGTMGEYGTPDIDIEEGWIDIDHRGRSDRFLFPRQGASLYHTTKILDTDLLWFYVRAYGLRVTDLMQGPVYGVATSESEGQPELGPHVNYDGIFGTVLNRFLVQAAVGLPLTVYGSGGQRRGFLNIEDTLQCVELALASPAGEGELRVFNQFTECFSVRELAEIVMRAGGAMGRRTRVSCLPNPRTEREQHYYNPASRGLLELGLEPHYLTDDVVAGMLERVLPYRDAVNVDAVMPRVQWPRP